EIENLIPFTIYKKHFKNLTDTTNRKWKYNNSKANESGFIHDMETMKVGNVIKKHFIDVDKRSSKNASINREDIACIGNKLDLALKFISIMEEENITFDDLPETTQKLTKRIHEFITENNTE
ncbi:MAG: hypothetical protein O6849_05450, partial [Candidatus Dadabacteria bacterium]|nr:hypothetical protein [Candidatus Dadabacteria bacterium]